MRKSEKLRCRQEFLERYVDYAKRKQITCGPRGGAVDGKVVSMQGGRASSHIIVERGHYVAVVCADTALPQMTS